MLEVFKAQIESCFRYGAPFSAALLSLAADDFEIGGVTRDLLSPWHGEHFDKIRSEAVPLRLLAGINLTVARENPGRARDYYPRAGVPGNPHQVWDRVRLALRSNPCSMQRALMNEPQTNEVGRSTALLAAAMLIAKRWERPLKVYELGASAGLNQMWDEFTYYINGIHFFGPKPPDVEVQVAWDGPLPHLHPTMVVESYAGCDIRPLHLNALETRQLLRAYVWPDHIVRLKRLDAAMSKAIGRELSVVQGDAADWINTSVQPVSGRATLIFHSVFWQYIKKHSKNTIKEAIYRLSRVATAMSPLFLLEIEPDAAEMKDLQIWLTSWPGGTRELLGTMHPHGLWLRWCGCA